MQSITIHAPAKVNLALEVCGLLPGGFHDLDMIMQAVTLYETIRLEKRPAGELTLECRAADGTLAADIPTDARNLAWRAARLFLDAAGIADGVFVSVTKAVPSQAGMADGSADAAGVLVGLDLLFETGMTVPQLCALGEQLGSDVPFCVVGGTCMCEGRGEKLRKLPNMPDCIFVVVKPEFSVSTPALYKKIDEVTIAKRPNHMAMESALISGDLDQVAKNVLNVFDPVVTADHLELNYIKSLFHQYGAISYQMTGSGSATFAIVSEFEVAAVICNMLKDNYPDVFICKPV